MAVTVMKHALRLTLQPSSHRWLMMRALMLIQPPWPGLNLRLSISQVLISSVMVVQPLSQGSQAAQLLVRVWLLSLHLFRSRAWQHWWYTRSTIAGGTVPRAQKNKG
jgi:hypothetical protein